MFKGRCETLFSEHRPRNFIKNNKKENCLWKDLVANNKNNRERERERETARSINRGMPLGNLTSQFFANVYLNELDQFVKHKLQAKYYIRYVDDFVILHSSKTQLRIWKKEVDLFLSEKLRLQLHPDKSKIINFSRGVDFVGFRNFYYYKLLRKRNIRKMGYRIKLYNEGVISSDKFLEIFQGWQAYARWANSYRLRKKLFIK